MIGSSFAYTPAFEARISAVKFTQTEEALVSRINNIVGPNIDLYWEKYRSKVINILEGIERKSSNVRMKATVRAMISYAEDYGSDDEISNIGSIGDLLEQEVQSTWDNTTDNTTVSQNTVPTVDYEKMSWDAINSDSFVTDSYSTKESAILLSSSFSTEDRLLVKYTANKPQKSPITFGYKKVSWCSFNEVLGKKVLIVSKDSLVGSEYVTTAYIMFPENKGTFARCEIGDKQALVNLQSVMTSSDWATLQQNWYGNQLR